MSIGKVQVAGEIVLRKAIDTLKNIIELPNDIKMLKASCGRTSFNDEAGDRDSNIDSDDNTM